MKSRPLLLVALLLAAAICGVYGRTVHFEFLMYDDPQYLAEDHILGGLTLAGLRWAFSAAHDANWIPLTWIGNMLSVQIFGLEPGSHHLVNAFFHAADSVLLLLVLFRMTGALWRSLFVVALFAVHPLHVESVAWVAERKDVLSAFFWFLTLLAYRRYAAQPAPGRYLLVIFLFACGLMTKPMLVTLPVILLLLDYWPLRRLRLPVRGAGATTSSSPYSLARLCLEKAPLLLLAVAAGIVTVAVQGQAGTVNRLDREYLLFNVANALLSYLRYLAKMFWPSGLAVFYPIEISISRWQVVGAFVSLAALTLWAFRGVGNRRYLTIGWLWYLITLVPVIGFLRVGAQAAADRYTYIPLIGPFIIIAWGAADLAARVSRGRAVFAGGAVGVVAALTVVTWFQLDHWRNNNALFERAIAVTERNWLAHKNLATALVGEKRFEEAFPHAQAAVRFKPDDATAFNILGVIHGHRRDIPRTIEAYKKALEYDPRLAEARFNLAMVYLGTGEKQKARAEWRILQGIQPAAAEKLRKYLEFADQIP